MHRYGNPPGYEDDPDEDTDREDQQDDGDYVDYEDRDQWDVCNPLWSPQPRG